MSQPFARPASSRQVSTERFDHAASVMRSKGAQPFSPDGPSAVRSARWLPASDTSDTSDAGALDASALPIDAVIAAFAVGVLLGMLIP